MICGRLRFSFGSSGPMPSTSCSVLKVTAFSSGWIVPPVAAAVFNHKSALPGPIASMNFATFVFGGNLRPVTTATKSRIICATLEKNLSATVSGLSDVVAHRDTLSANHSLNPVQYAWCLRDSFLMGMDKMSGCVMLSSSSAVLRLRKFTNKFSMVPVFMLFSQSSYASSTSTRTLAGAVSKAIFWIMCPSSCARISSVCASGMPSLMNNIKSLLPGPNGRVAPRSPAAGAERPMIG